MNQNSTYCTSFVTVHASLTSVIWRSQSLIGNKIDWLLWIHIQIKFVGHTVASCNLATPCFERGFAL